MGKRLILCAEPGMKDLASQLGDEIYLPPGGCWKVPLSQFLKAKATALSGALSCFEKVCALALAFVFLLQKQK